jgi:hypothetical protein
MTMQVGGKRIYLTHYPNAGTSIAAYVDGDFVQLGMAITNEKPHEPTCPTCGQKFWRWRKSTNSTVSSVETSLLVG